MASDELTHASFFSGVGGMDLGLERAGWRTVSHSEIDPYASAVLAERWPGVPNLGDITRLAADVRPSHHGGLVPDSPDRGERDGRAPGRADGPDWQRATLWTGGFPCQDLSVAGKRRGMGTADERTRSGLAFAFLDLVERHRPPWLVLENVPGLLSSNGGRDLGALLGALGELGYGWAYRILDARYFGVAQRRRRVFIVGSLGTDRASAVLLEPDSGAWDPAPRREARAGAADRFDDGVGGAGALPQSINAKWSKGYSGPAGDEHHNLIVSPPIRSGGHGDPGIGRDNDHDRLVVAHGLSTQHGVTEDGTGRGVPIVVGTPPDADRVRAPDGLAGRAHDLLPLGLDSHRYRCCGNGVVAPVAEWLGRRIIEVMLAGERQDVA